MTPVDSTTQWREDWQSASVVHYTTVTDPTIQQRGFDLARHSWSLLNRLRTGQGPCRAILHKWGLAKSLTCKCQLTVFDRVLQLFHQADDDAVKWLEAIVTTAFAK